MILPLVEANIAVKTDLNTKALYENEVLMVFLMGLSVMVIVGLLFVNLVSSQKLLTPTSEDSSNPPGITVSV